MLAAIGAGALALLVALVVSLVVARVDTVDAGPSSADPSDVEVGAPWAPDGEPGSAPGAPSGSVRPVTVPADAEAAIVDRVVDGDTIRVVAAPGGSIPQGGSIRIRLLNIDAPERGSVGDESACGAREATLRVEELLAPGDLVWLAADVEDRDRFDRTLRAAWTTDGVFVNRVLVEEGWAVAVLFRPNDRFHAEMVEAERVARARAAGIHGAHCR